MQVIVLAVCLAGVLVARHFAAKLAEQVATATPDSP